MKNLLVSSLLMGMLFTSCNNTKVLADNEKLMRGDWTITDVSVDGINEKYVDITVFDQAKSQCFKGSSWHLVQNNATGNYTLNGGNGCPSETTKIKWFVTESNGQMYYNFKKVFEGEKPKNVVDGYKMRVASNTGSSLVLQQEMTFEGKPISVFYTFSKN